jgi:hypothetical protein
MIQGIENFGFRPVAESEPPAPDGKVAPDRVILFVDSRP